MEPPVVSAGAWTVPRNRWYVEYFYRYFAAKRDFDPDGESVRKAKAGRFTDFRNELKLEYGLTDAINLLASAPYQSSHHRDDSTDLLTTNVGDIYVRTKLRVLEEPVVTSLQASWKIPSAYNPNESPALGDGQFDYETRLQLSRAWTFAPYEVPVRRPATVTREAVMEAELERVRRTLARDDAVGKSAPVTAPSRDRVETETRYAGVAFVNLEGGFTARNEDPANEFPVFLEAGMTPFKRLMLVASLDSVLSVKSTDEQTEDFSKWGIRGIWNIWGDGFASVFRKGEATVNVELGYNDIFAGRNTADAYEIFGKVGVSF